MLPRIWSFIRNSKNREVVSWLGGGAALIVAGGYPTTISSTTAARDGTISSISPGESCPSDCANGPTGSAQWDSVLGERFSRQSRQLTAVMNRGVPAHLSPQVPPQSDDAMFPGLALLAENSARNLEPLLQPIPVPNQRQMLLCKLLERANIGIKRPGKNLSFLRLCRDARVVFDEGNSLPFGLNARQRYGYRCQIITKVH